MENNPSIYCRCKCNQHKDNTGAPPGRRSFHGFLERMIDSEHNTHQKRPSTKPSPRFVDPDTTSLVVAEAVTLLTGFNAFDKFRFLNRLIHSSTIPSFETRRAKKNDAYPATVVRIDSGLVFPSARRDRISPTSHTMNQ